MTNPFAPQRKNLVCTDIFGGPQQAVIAGRYKGERIWTRSGCGTAARSHGRRSSRSSIPGFSANPNS